MHLALSIQEVLLRIFGLLPQACNARNARVCKAWSPVALDCLWRDIADVSDVFFSLAGGMRLNSDDTWVCLPSHLHRRFTY